MRVLGVDPGLSGALALYDSTLDGLIVRDMPVLPIGRGTKNTIAPAGVAEIVEAFAPDVAWIEFVSASPQQGVTSAFNFGCGYGIILGVMGAVKVPYHLVVPRVWKQHFHLDKDKRASRAVASRLFPRNAGEFVRVKDDGRAEAALLAHFGMHAL